MATVSRAEGEAVRSAGLVHDLANESKIPTEKVECPNGNSRMSAYATRGVPQGVAHLDEELQALGDAELVKVKRGLGAHASRVATERTVFKCKELTLTSAAIAC